MPPKPAPYIYIHHSTGATALTTGFTRGAGQIWLDRVQCRGGEARLIDCPANPLGIHSCTHFEDAGVICFSGNAWFHLTRIATAGACSVEAKNNVRWA